MCVKAPWMIKVLRDKPDAKRRVSLLRNDVVFVFLPLTRQTITISLRNNISKVLEFGSIASACVPYGELIENELNEQPQLEF